MGFTESSSIARARESAHESLPNICRVTLSTRDIHAMPAKRSHRQYEIHSDLTDHIAMHKGAVLHKID
jgi:hypothetical protein